MRSKRTIAKGFIWMLIVSVITLLGYNRLYKNQRPYLDEVGNLRDSGQSICLDSNTNPDELSDFLISNHYLQDKKDANTIAHFLVDKIKNAKKGHLRNLGQINTRPLQIPAALIDSIGGEILKKRLQQTRINLGVDDAFKDAVKEEIQTGVFRESDSATCAIIVNIKSKTKLSTTGIPVRLKRHFYDTITTEHNEIAACDSVVAIIRTDSKGKAVFYVQDGNYSVVPIEDGYEFGVAQGSTHGKLEKGKHKYIFNKKELRIKSLPPELFKEIKKYDALTARTPESYSRHLTGCYAILLFIWWLAFISIGIISRKIKDGRDIVLIPFLMFLNITGILVLFGIPHPLSDSLLGVDMTLASILGIIMMTAASFVPVARIFATGYKLPGMKIPFEPIPNTIKGVTYLLLSFLLIFLLAIFGSSPEGSDAKINLFFLQPSEVCKYLAVVFMAAFFAENATAIRKFSQTTNKVSLSLQLRTVTVVMAAIFVISMLYMGILSDMGPALVLLVTFIFIYSFARRDFLQLLIGVATFFALFYLMSNVLPQGKALLVTALIWYAVWIVIGLLINKTIYESAIFFNTLILLFASGSSLLSVMGFKHQSVRLQTRMMMTGTGVWDNAINGSGDQVAQAIWGYSNGGLFGQGLGLGNANLIPAAHTDMIFASGGEQLGLIGITSILLAFAIILYRCYDNGRKSGNPFSFYLAAGIGSVTVVQFLIIALGSVGFIPLTGVATPFLSYAKTSIVINLAAMGLVIAISKENAGEYQQAEMDAYKPTLRYSFLTYSVLSSILFIILSGHMLFHRNESMLRSGLYSDETGRRTFHYNPRIKVLEEKLYIQPIYDRNGLLLATSSNDKALLMRKEAIEAGVSPTRFDEDMAKRTRRYYPFGAHTFFMVGDYNTKTLWSSSIDNPYGYNAENRFLSQMRGFDNQDISNTGDKIIRDIHMTTYRPNRFLQAIDYPRNRREMRYDYTELLPLLKKGIAGHREIRSYDNLMGTEVHLTLDAALQTRLQNTMADYIKNDSELRELTKLRASVVVLDCHNGDLLCSANYPLPDMVVLDSLMTNKIYVYNEKDENALSFTDRDLGLTYQTHPGSTAKIMTALAGYRKYGNKIASVTYDIDINEIIENGKVKEPYSTIDGKRYTGKVNMTDAIVRSSNCYFINLMTDKNLYPDLGYLYETVGIRLDGHEDRANITPYFFYEDDMADVEEYEKEVVYLETQGLSNYETYKNARKNRNWTKMNKYHGSADYWGIAYGQGQLYATPLNIARVGTIIANNGTYVQTRYTLPEEVNRTKVIPDGTAKLAKDMMKEADKHRQGGIMLPGNKDGVEFMSKTGTPERTWIHYNENMQIVVEKPNDGWYLFVINTPNKATSLSVAIRLERLGTMGSKTAVRFASEVVLPVLQQCGYEVY